MSEYKQNLLGKLETLRKEVESSKNYFSQVEQDYTEEYYFSGSHGDKWEAEEARKDKWTAEIFLRLLSNMISQFNKEAD